MATTQITHPPAARIGPAVIVAAVAVVAGLGAAVVVAASIILAPGPTTASYVLGQDDDYGLRHAFGPAALAPTDQDDWWLRHHGAGAVLGEADDWYTRHRGDTTRR